MELGPILRSMLNSKVKVGLLVAEIAITVAIVLNALAIIGHQRRSLATPSGLDEDNIVTVRAKPYLPAFAEREFATQVVDRDLAALRRLDGVVDATVISPFPLQGGGSSFQLKPMGAPDSAWVRSPVYRADHHFLDALGLELVAGRAFTEADVPVDRGPQILNIIITQDLADALHPEGALGKTINTGSEEYPDVVVGIVRQMHTPYGGGPMEDRITFYPGRPVRRDGGSEYLVRTEPGELAAVTARIGETLAGVEGGRLIETRSLSEVKGVGFLAERLTISILTIVIGLLLFVTAIGIFGVTTFTVAQRTRQIGTRRALGAGRAAILRYFLVENSLIAVAGVGLGLIGALALNVGLVNQMEGARLGAGVAIGGALLLWAIGVLATVLPARRAARVPPAVATRSV